ncbi:hypothetical protein J7S33_24105, partial [Saccharothrix algeriensis]
TAVDRLRKAIAVLNDVRASGTEDAHQRAELLSRALDHSRRHANEDICPVCGADRPLGAFLVRAGRRAGGGLAV